MFLKQEIMRRVLYALVPLGLWSIWLYGWRVMALGVVVFSLGILAELIFENHRQKKVSEAVLVTCTLLTLSLPPAVPLWVAAIASVFAVVMGKQVYGGFGRNIFNPAIAGRMFTYISFPLLMQTTWMLPGSFGLGGLNRQVTGSGILEAVVVGILCLLALWLIQRNPGQRRILVAVSIGGTVLLVAFYVLASYLGWRTSEVDVITTATPLEIYRGVTWNQVPVGAEYLKANDPLSLFLGYRVGSIGEGSIFLILLAGLYLLITKTANWRTMLMVILAALVATLVFYYAGLLKGRLPLLDPTGKDWIGQFSDVAGFMMSGSLLFVAVFMATDPVSAPNKPGAQIVYGLLIGLVTIIIRSFSGFPEGTSFAVLTANTFANLLDEVFPAPKKKAVKAKTPEAPPGVAKTEGGLA